MRTLCYYNVCQHLCIYIWEIIYHEVCKIWMCPIIDIFGAGIRQKAMRDEISYAYHFQLHCSREIYTPTKIRLYHLVLVCRDFLPGHHDGITPYPRVLLIIWPFHWVHVLCIMVWRVASIHGVYPRLDFYHVRGTRRRIILCMRIDDKTMITILSVPLYAVQ